VAREYIFPAACAKGAGPATNAAPNPLKNFHRATIISKKKFIRFRYHKNKFGDGVDVVWGIKSRKHRGPRGGVVYPHAINFNATNPNHKTFTVRQAKMWLKQHNYSPIKFEAATGKHVPAKRKVASKRVANRVTPSGVEFQYVATAAPVANPRKTSGVAKQLEQTAIKVLSARSKAAQVAAGMTEATAKKVLKIRGYTDAQIASIKSAVRNPQLMVLNKRKNPQLLVLSNPKKSNGKEVAAAKKAFNRFHFKDPDKTFSRKVPDSWPNAFVVIGECEMFSVKSNGKTVKRTFMGNGKMPLLCMGKGMKDVFIVGTKNLGVPAGNAVQVDYRVPKKSGRNKWARRWYHPHDTKPKVNVSKDGRYVRISGPGLHVTPRGIIG